MIKGIVCVDKNWGIGKKNGLLFHLSADMKFFKDNTLNCVVVMGENTLLSFPKKQPLKYRVNIVLCPEGHEYEGCICYHDFDRLVKDLRILSTQLPIWIIGGGMMYRSMLPYYDEVLVTKVDAEDKGATVFFPNLDDSEDFMQTKESDIQEEDGIKFKFTKYKRKNA